MGKDPDSGVYILTRDGGKVSRKKIGRAEGRKSLRTKPERALTKAAERPGMLPTEIGARINPATSRPTVLSNFDNAVSEFIEIPPMSKRQVSCVTSVIAVSSVVLAIAFPAWAALGGDVSSVQADQVRLQGSLQTISNASYTVHEIHAVGGAVVREYVASSGKSAGKVFAIAWQGPWPPDMRQLLGSYFDQYVQAAKAQTAARMGRRPLTIEQPGLVVEIGGHPRSFFGRAFLPDQLPSGVSNEAIQ
jgi:hypothetical protein